MEAPSKGVFSDGVSLKDPSKVDFSQPLSLLSWQADDPSSPLHASFDQLVTVSPIESISVDVNQSASLTLKYTLQDDSFRLVFIEWFKKHGPTKNYLVSRTNLGYGSVPQSRFVRRWQNRAEVMSGGSLHFKQVNNHDFGTYGVRLCFAPPRKWFPQICNDKMVYGKVKMKNSDDALTEEEKEALLEEHNIWRKMKGKAPLKWAFGDTEEWAKHVISCKDTFWPGPKGTSTNYAHVRRGKPAAALDGWANQGEPCEGRSSDGSCRTPDGGAECNQFSNIMSTNVTRIACAAKKCTNGRKLICLYADKDGISGSKRKRRSLAAKDPREGAAFLEQSLAGFGFQLEGWIA